MRLHSRPQGSSPTAASQKRAFAADLRRSTEAGFRALPAPSPWVVRAATILGVTVPVYGLLRLFTGLLHWILPPRILEAVPELVSDVHNTHAIASGVLLFLLGLRLLKRQRLSYSICLVVLLGSAVSGIVIGVTPWFWGTGLAVFATLLPLGRVFTRQARFMPTPSQVVGIVAILLALAYGIVGAYLLRDQYTNLRTWGDAVYFAVTTLTTLGYGDIVPAGGSASAKVFAVSLVIVGLSAFVTALSLVVVPFLESQVKEVMHAMDRFRKRALRGHVVLCFYSQVGESVASQLTAEGIEFLIVEPDEQKAEALSGEGLRVLQGNPTDEKTLAKANLGEASAILACSDRDADNAMITLIAHDVKASGRNVSLRIAARIEQEDGIRKLEAAGADYVVSPSTLGGRMMATFAAGKPDQSPPPV